MTTTIRTAQTIMTAISMAAVTASAGNANSNSHGLALTADSANPAGERRRALRGGCSSP